MFAGRIFSIIFFLSVCFAGITSLMNMFEAVIESLQHKFNMNRKLAVVLCGIICFGVGIFLESESAVGNWMDFITIIIVPFGALFGAFSIYYIFGFDKIKEELNQGNEKGIPAWFGSLAKYVYVPLTVIVFILGIIFKGIG